MKPLGDKLIRSIAQARANFAMMLIIACYNQKHLISIRHRTGIEAF